MRAVFKNAGQQRVVDGGQLLGRLDHGIGGAGHAALHKVGLLGGAVLGNRHGGAGGRHGQALGQLASRAGGHVFKFGGDGRAELGQLGQALRVFVAGAHMVVADQTQQGWWRPGPARR